MLCTVVTHQHRNGQIMIQLKHSALLFVAI